MDPSQGASVQGVTFDHTVRVEASAAPFEFLETTGYLDVDRLVQADRARIPLGVVQTECCRRLVHGVVEKGMLTALEFDGQDDEPGAGAADAETLELLRAASAALGSAGPTRKLPIPVADVLAEVSLAIQTWHCVRICVLGRCITCCWGEDPTGHWGICGPIEVVGATAAR
jgi:hypothetical protein